MTCIMETYTSVVALVEHENAVYRIARHPEAFLVLHYDTTIATGTTTRLFKFLPRIILTIVYLPCTCFSISFYYY